MNGLMRNLVVWLTCQSGRPHTESDRTSKIYIMGATSNIFTVCYFHCSAFSVASEDDLYRVTVDCPCSGTAGIGFADKRHSMSQMAFSTSDRDNDLL